MKKSLVALAALAVVGAASAQSSVTLYGYGDLGVGQNMEGVNPLTGVRQGSQGKRFNPNTSDAKGIRIGLKGSEDLGGGLKANFQLESNSYDGNSGVGSGFQRANWFSISGGFGEVRLGRQVRNSVVAGVLASPARGRGTDPELAVGTRYSIENNIGASSRTSSMVNYISPTFSGFSGRVGIEGRSDFGYAGGYVIDLALLYSNGPLSVSYGRIKADNLETNQGLHAKYNFGMFALMGSYNDRGAIAGTATAAPLAAAKGFTIGATMPFGATNVFATYAKNNDAAASLTTNGHSYAYELGADYNLSKRTALTAAIGGTEGLDAGYFVGVRHSF